MPDKSVPVKLSRRAEWSANGAISFLMQQGLENADVLSLAAGFVDPSTLPVEEAREGLAMLLADESRARECLQYGTTQGARHLRDQLVKYFANQEGATPDQLGLDEFFVTTGSQQLLSIVSEILFDPGDICLVAAPTYFVFLGVLQGVGARAIPVETDGDGMNPDALEAMLEQIKSMGELDRVKLIYLVSYYENPSGVSLATDRRKRMVEIAQKWSQKQRIFILEDAAYRELRYDGERHPSIWSFDETRETVIYTQTFSKSFSPGFRVGFGIVPQALRKAVSDRKGNEDFGSAHLNQRLIAQVLDKGRFESHVEKVRESYRTKRDAMLDAAEEFFSDIEGVTWEHPHGGLYVWMSLPESIETGFESPLFQEAVKNQQVMFVPGELCYPPNSPQKSQMRLSYGVLTPERIREGMRRLSVAIKNVMARADS